MMPPPHFGGHGGPPGGPGGPGGPPMNVSRFLNRQTVSRNF